ncbi:hypothetical protein FDG48_05600 [Clostridium sporogenes]|nr:hypothetical protein [Clostridium sporogenes]
MYYYKQSSSLQKKFLLLLKLINRILRSLLLRSRYPLGEIVIQSHFKEDGSIRAGSHWINISI